MRNRSVNIISLGCPRNLVDSEVILGLLKKANFRISENIEGTDTVIVNTCAFIEDAKKESIDVILQLADLKKQNKISHIIVSGCLSQRYKDVLGDEMKEVDGFIGVGDIKNIVDTINTLSSKKKTVNITKQPKFLYDHTDPRLFITPRHYAYVKIQEGCINRCSYCVIPDLRGGYRSRSLDSVVKETEALLNKKNPVVSEINLIGQDTTLYGIDLYKKKMLAELLKKLSKLPKKEAWIRLLYTHPAHFTDELITVLKEFPVCKYVDLPIQHIDDGILKKMNRGIASSGIKNIIKKLRDNIPHVTLRTSVIVGFPQETEEQFEKLLDFIKETRFEHLGAFVYSREEGTPAYSFKGQLPESVKQERLDRIMKAQQHVSSQKNKEFLNKTIRVLIDKKAPKEDNLFLARTEGDAPEVDGGVYVRGENLAVGSFVNVKVIDTFEYDLVGEVAS